jgi:GNAT superfamily N-acetyltransferase
MSAEIIKFPTAEFRIERCSVEQIVPLRHRILRAGLPIEEAHFPKDDDPATRHVAALIQPENRAVCCATMVASEWQNQPAFQLRGMATDSNWQSKGLGQRVLAHLIQIVQQDSGIKLFWCNGRIGALEFYKRQGWTVESELFDIPTAGLHHKMKLDLR